MSELPLPALPGEEDYRRYDRIWRRVSPELDPYPEARAQNAAETRLAAPGGAGTCRLDGGQDAELLRGFLRDELSDAQTYRCLASLAPTQEARRLMRRLSADESAHARTLQAIYFLATGDTYPVTVVLPPQPRLLWRDRLRGRYHAEVCGAQQYARIAEQTADVCLKRALERLSADEYRHAELLRRAVGQTL